MKKTVIILIVSLILLDCAAHTNLMPVGKKKWDINASMGGPIVSAFGMKVAIPYATVGTNYGISNRLNLTGNFHLLPLMYHIAGIDVGPTWFPLLNDGATPTIGIQPRILALASLKSEIENRVRLYPVISGSSCWLYKKGTFYTGFDLTIPVTQPVYDDKASSFIFSPFVGYRWNLGKKTKLFTELKWHASNIASNELVVEYLNLANKGAISTIFAIERSF